MSAEDTGFRRWWSVTVATLAAVGALAAVLDDLCFRFLNNLPASEYESFERLFFAVENAGERVGLVAIGDDQWDAHGDHGLGGLDF